ncbi:class I SAM-dependent methyltransferase [Frigidibacter sp. MR17.24]|uniref:class I SAM-dependent methyltransferase n=1 Tax=Frigidibacter sp. MR17.24 TaxID=3127345 RepID=UPI003012A42A
MSALARRIAARIAATGPIPLSDYMADCLTDPEHGYYVTRDPLGRAGDFTTAPEISQMFGEMLGLCLAQAWADQGGPGSFVLAELGPGRGTLMADVLRVVARMPGMAEAAQVHMVEASPALRARQRAALGDRAVQWHDRVEALPDDRPLFLLANEFFDALPIRQFERAGAGWRERLVGLSDDGSALRPGLGPVAGFPSLDHRLGTAAGRIVETCPALPAITAALAGRIARHGGLALILDYGDWDGTGDTLQAVRDHAFADPFAAPGEADLTAHVDFAALAAAAEAAGAAASAMTPQGLLLERLGITARARQLAQGLAGAALDTHVAAHRRLTHPGEMGRVFKGLAITPREAPPPAGFDR